MSAFGLKRGERQRCPFFKLREGEVSHDFVIWPLEWEDGHDVFSGLYGEKVNHRVFKSL